MRDTPGVLLRASGSIVFGGALALAALPGWDEVYGPGNLRLALLLLGAVGMLLPRILR